MKKILLILLVGIALFIVAALIRDPEKVLPPQLNSQLSQTGTKCPDPFIFTIPVNLDKVTSILYPGQVRGGDFKAHGGFRFDTSHPNEITVRAPYTARVIAGARYPGTTGELQYTFDFEHPCGIRYRFGHLLTLTPKFQAIADKFPLPKILDSRTTQVSPPIEVKEGEIIATGVGLTMGGPEALKGLNAFVDWGVYDHRQKNEASEDPEWVTTHTSETYQYAVCWFDWIAPDERERVLALPSSDGEHGKESAYCK